MIYMSTFLMFLFHFHVFEKQITPAEMFSTMLLMGFVSYLLKMLNNGFSFLTEMTLVFGRVISLLDHNENEEKLCQ